MWTVMLQFYGVWIGPRYFRNRSLLAHINRLIGSSDISIILQFLSGGEFWGIISGALLKMELGICKGAWWRAWRYPAYLWSLRWVYAVKKTPEVGVRRIPAYTPPQCTTEHNTLRRSSLAITWLCLVRVILMDIFLTDQDSQCWKKLAVKRVNVGVKHANRKVRSLNEELVRYIAATYVNRRVKRLNYLTFWHIKFQKPSCRHCPHTTVIPDHQHNCLHE